MARVTKRPADEVVVDDTTMADDGTVVQEPVYAETVDTADGRVVDRDRVTRLSDADTRDDMLARERDAFGGMKFGTAFFGWLTALGVGVLLTAIVAAVATAIGLSTDDAVVSIRTLGITGLIVVAVVLFVAYLAGGYVAGRMARFSGAAQGFAVWLWAIIAAVLLAILGVALGDRFDVLSNLDAFPRIPLAAEDLTVTGIITAVVFAAIALVGALLGGMAGMAYHRRVDRAGVDVVE
jgi:hypothetical protein